MSTSRTALVVVAMIGVTACSDPTATPDAQGATGPPNAGKQSQNAVKSVTVTPATATVAVGETVQLTATAFGTGGRVLQTAAITWKTQNAAVASVTSTGLVTGLAAGGATITAESGGKVGTATVTVERPAPPPATTGDLVVRVATTGSNPDAGYTAVLDHGTTQSASQPLPANGAVTFAAVAAGEHTVTLGDVAANCTTDATDNAKSATVVGGGSVEVAFTVACTAPPATPAAVLLAAGDIARCSSTGDEATAALVDNMEGTVAVLGDNVYTNGTITEYTNCYTPSWGRASIKGRTRPSAGNHEYGTPGAAGYFEYFGAAAGDPAKGYYSYTLGEWHVVVLNSNLPMAAGSAQEQWLRADLAASRRQCTLAYWHHPRFNSGASHGNNAATQPLWQALYDFDADVILNGHEHIYERFAPQTPAGVADAARGIRQFTVGTGGASHYAIGTIKPNSEVRDGDTYGVLKLTLGSGNYTWQFVPVAGATFQDSGAGSCH